MLEKQQKQQGCVCLAEADDLFRRVVCYCFFLEYREIECQAASNVWRGAKVKFTQQT